jgi:hypothetical protein
MKSTTKLFFSCIILFLSILTSSVYAQTPSCVICGSSSRSGHASSCKYHECHECGANSFAHRDWCKSKGSGSGGSSGGSGGGSVEEIVAGALINYLFAPSNNNNAEADRIAAEKRKTEQAAAEEEARQRAAEQKRINDSISKAKYDTMMKSYKTLDTNHPLGMKPIETSTVKFKTLDAAIETDAKKEQKKLEGDTQTWVEYQKEQFKIRLEQPNYWCKHYYENLEKQKGGEKTLADFFPNKKSTQLEPGDVILVGPSSDQDYFSVKQANLDAWASDNNAYVTHTVTCIKVVDGKRLYLDNQASEGPRIISEDEFQKRYGKRDNSVAELRKTPWGVAQPLNKEEADKLWTKARELSMKNKDNTNPLATNYGLYGNDNMVCSEASWQLLNATGRYQIPFDKKMPLISGIDFTPASFYNKQQYFLITPLDMQK